jgi:hypothetical protein
MKITLKKLSALVLLAGIAPGAAWSTECSQKFSLGRFFRNLGVKVVAPVDPNIELPDQSLADMFQLAPMTLSKDGTFFYLDNAGTIPLAKIQAPNEIIFTFLFDPAKAAPGGTSYFEETFGILKKKFPALREVDVTDRIQLRKIARTHREDYDHEYTQIEEKLVAKRVSQFLEKIEAQFPGLNLWISPRLQANGIHATLTPQAFWTIFQHREVLKDHGVSQLKIGVIDSNNHRGKP